MLFTPVAEIFSPALRPANFPVLFSLVFCLHRRNFSIESGDLSSNRITILIECRTRWQKDDNATVSIKRSTISKTNFSQSRTICFFFLFHKLIIWRISLIDNKLAWISQCDRQIRCCYRVRQDHRICFVCLLSCLLVGQMTLTTIGLIELISNDLQFNEKNFWQN